MFAEIPQNLILMTFGAFLFGWILSSINARISSRYEAKKRDSRDDRIRSLEAEQRVAAVDGEKLRETMQLLKKDLEEAQDGVEKRDNVITHQQERLDDLKKDLKDSVKKTRELRAELTDRAEQNLKSEVKLREVETELSVAQASTDLIATGVLDYSVAPDKESVDKESADDEGVAEAANESSMTSTAS